MAWNLYSGLLGVNPGNVWQTLASSGSDISSWSDSVLVWVLCWCLITAAAAAIRCDSSALSSGADANERDANGDTALLYIARAG